MKILRLVLASLALASAGAAQEAAPEPAEGTLNAHLNFNPKEVKDQLELLIQEVYKLKTELIISNFRGEYGDHIRMRRVNFAANTADHEAIPGYVFTPLNLPAGKKFPAILMLHGGDHTQLVDYFFGYIAAAVEHGYVVMFPEYRGSSGHGDFIYENNYGVTDFADVQAATTFLAQQSYVDPARLGILGHSRGGMMTLRAIELEPKRFAAAVEIAALSDMVGFMGWKPQARREDIASQKGFGGKMPDRNLPAYMAISPALYLDKVNTPLLVASTTGDKTNVYELNNRRVVEGLKAYNKTFTEVLYHNAPGGHQFAFEDSDEARDLMTKVFAWFGKYLTP
jgi:dipeptidyl aminopeptidase/acylaminoacyl peptidase